MVSCAKDLFRRSGCDETFRAETGMISMKLKLEDFRRGKISFYRNIRRDDDAAGG
jgi:hypothetical protein